MMRRRMGRPGLVGTMARTAVVAGTATAVAGWSTAPTEEGAGASTRRTPRSKRRSTRNSRSPRCRQQMNAMQAQQAAPPPPPAPAPVAAAPAAAPAPDLMAEITKLADLKAAGYTHRRRVLRGKSQAAGLIERHDDQRRGHVSFHLPETDVEAAAASTTPERSRRPGSAPGWLVWTMIVLASVVAIGASMNAWLNRQVLDTDNWVEASDQVLEEPAVRAALSTYLVNELFSYVDVSTQLQDRLPDSLPVLAGPISPSPA